MKQFRHLDFRWRKGLAFLCCSLILGVGQANAIFNPNNGGLVSNHQESGTWPVNTDNGSGYRNPTITYIGRSNFYLLTTDTLTYKSINTAYVTFDGTSGTATPTSTGGSNEFTCTVIHVQDANGDGEFEFTNELTGKANSTIFIDGGAYFLNTISYTAFAPGNTALIGLTDPKGANPVVFKQMPVLKGNSSGTVTARYLQRQLLLDNTLLMNLVFDADGYGAVADRPTCSNATRYSISYTRDSKDNESGITWVTSGNPWSSNRGNTFFYTSTSQSVLIRNITIKNIGAADGATIGNFAINIGGNSSGQINIENVTIENCRGSSTDSFRLLQINASKNVNLKDLTFIQGANGQLRDLVWIENPLSTTIPAGELLNEDVRFFGDITYNGYDGHQRIGIQQTSYGNITVPASFRYAVFSVGTTSSVLSGSTQADIFVYKSLNDFTQTWGSSNNDKKVIFDLVDSCWLVRPQGIGVAPTVDQQLTGINTVLQRMAQALNLSGNTNQNGRGLITKACIKIVADVNGNVPADFTTVPEFGISSTAPNVHIRMMPSSAMPWDTNFYSPKTHVPINEGHNITLAGTAANVRLYGIDFHSKAQTTLHEALGAANATSYNSSSTPAPSTDVANARVTNATETNLEICEYTALAKNIRTDATRVACSTSPDFTLVAYIDSFYSYSSAGSNGTQQFYRTDDTTKVWSSSNTGVATVDPATGLVHIVGAGTATITVTAADSLNQGEIIKPFAACDLSITKADTTINATLCTGSVYDFDGWIITEAGTYTKTLTTVSGCDSIVTLVLDYVPPIVVDGAVTQPTCATPNTGSISLIVTGGVDPNALHFEWSNGANTKDLSNLTAGEYIVTVTDTLCIGVAPVKMTYFLTAPGVDPIVVDGTVTQPTCAAPNTGAITLSVTGGVNAANLLYDWSDGVDTKDRTNLSAGTYIVSVTDPDCPAVAPVQRTFILSASDVAPIVVNGTVVNPTCAAPSTGTITLSVTGGVDPDALHFEWSNGANTKDLSNLTAGEYIVTVTDTLCIGVAPVKMTYFLHDPTITPLRLIVTTKSNPSCANNDGEIEVLATGGSPSSDIRYHWSNGITTANAGNALAAGSYIVTVWDENCRAVAPVTLIVTLEKNLNLIEIKLDEKVDPTCPGGNNGKINVSVIGDNGNYRYEWTGPNGFTAAVEDVSGLSAGLYRLRVSASGDNYSCSATLDNIELKDPIDWTAATLSDYIGLVGKTLYYKNGAQVNIGALMSGALPENTFANWTATGDSIGIATGGGNTIPEFTAYNPNVGGASQAVVMVKIGNSECAGNFKEGMFTIVITSGTVQDNDLLANAVVSQEKCAETAFDDITFTAKRTDGAALGEVSYIVEFVSGTDVLKGAQLGELPVSAAGLWNISSVAVANRVIGQGAYRVTPRSLNGEGRPATFTLAVLPAPNVDEIPDFMGCNNTPYYYKFTGKDATYFRWETDAAAQSLGIPASGYNNIDVNALHNTTSATVEGTITVTALSSDCPGLVTREYKIIVLPTPTVDPINNLVIENGFSQPTVPFSGNATTYRWTNDTPSISQNGQLSSGTGTEFPAFTAANGLAYPTTAKVTVTPIYEDKGYACEGTPTEFYILVAPHPAINPIADRILCEGEAALPFAPDGLPAGNAYFITWQGGATIGLSDNADETQTSRLRSIAGFAAAHTVADKNAPQVVTVTVTPWITINGLYFSGDAVEFNITVNPVIRVEAGYEENITEAREYCTEEETRMEVKATGINLTYQWYKDHIAIAGATSAEYIIPASEVDHTTSGSYYAVATGTCGSLKAKTYDIQVKLNIIYQRWDDVLSVNRNTANNGGFTFYDFQWYADGVALKGETQSYLHVAGGLNPNTEYYVVMKADKEVDGKMVTTDYKSCPAIVDVTSEAPKVSVYPNPVPAGRTITIGLGNIEPSAVTIHLVDHTGKILKVAGSGSLTPTTQLIAPNQPGVYIIRILVSDGYTKEFKVIVK